MYKPASLLKTLLVYCFTCTLFLLTGTNAFAGSPYPDNDKGSSKLLKAAEQAYEAGHYDEVVKLTREHLRTDGMSAIERIEAYRLQSLAYNARGQHGKARAAAEEIVLVFPTYKPAPEDPEAFVALVQDAQQRYHTGELKRKTEKKSRVLQTFYTGTAVVMSAIVIGLSSQDW